MLRREFRLGQTRRVVKTGARATVLSGLLERLGYRRGDERRLPAPRLGSLSPDLTDQVVDLYRSLGGRADAATLRPGAWDLVFDDGLIVELDEELHFNRYRALSLTAEWTAPLPWRGDYLGFCGTFEPECLAAGRWGKRWTNPSCASLFGDGGPPGDLDLGSPRWKQRALYDAMKDAWYLSGHGERLVRISTHDVVEGVPLGAVLDGRSSAPPDLDALAALVHERGGSG